MTVQSRKRYMALASVLIVVGGLAIACSLWVKQEQRQYALNRQLIEALDQSDIKMATALVEIGADPNTRRDATPLPTWSELLQQLLDRSPPPANVSPTGFMLTCGRDWLDSPDHLVRVVPDAPDLVETMLHHGALVNARDSNGMTALMMASQWNRTRTIEQLLQRGANPEIQDDNGWTALHYAVTADKAEGIKILLKYHVNVNVKDKQGITPLAVALHNMQPPPTSIIRVLKQAGATE